MNAYHAPEIVDCARGTTGAWAEVGETADDGKGPLVGTVVVVVVVVLLDTRETDGCEAASARSSLTISRTICSNRSRPSSDTCVEGA